MTVAPALPIEYVIPLRWSADTDLPEFTCYLRSLRGWVDVTVVDGSCPALFAAHRVAWTGLARHLPVGRWPGRNRKVAAVLTGINAARHELVVIADDDVRYGPEQLSDMANRLDDAELVRPQNVFRPLPWHARWDTARSLINRAFGSDYPGTLGLRRSFFRRVGGYDGDVLFENLQLIRTITAGGGREIRADDLFVTRRPPTCARFAEQRIRQAYDDFAQPARLVWEASWLPALVLTALRRPGALPLLFLLPTLVAELGRRRHRGRDAFPASSALWAPLWILERAITVWIAVAQRAGGGARYRGQRIRVAATRPASCPPQPKRNPPMVIGGTR